MTGRGAGPEAAAVEGPARQRTVLVLVDGSGGVVEAAVPAADAVVAADSGLVVADRLGLDVDVAVGDFDSAPGELVAAAERAGARIERHPVAKDATDLELALAAAVELGAARVVVVGGAAGRFDHVLGNALVLASPAFAGVRVEARVGAARIWVVRDRVPIDAGVGALVSLLAVGGPAEGVVTEGLRFPLRGEVLTPGSSRGLSNQQIAVEAGVAVTSGVLLAVAPDPAGPTS